MTSTPDLDTLARLARAATPGSRKYIGQDDDAKRVEIGKGRWECRWSNASQVGADGMFIAACSSETILGLVARVRELEEALREIEIRRTPCEECGKVHEWRAGVPEGFVGTWADPIDGHDYKAEKPSLTAQKVLAKCIITPSIQKSI